MQFELRLRQGLHDGSITVAFRRWRRPQVVAGRAYRTGSGLVQAEAIDTIRPADITDDLARRAGFPSAEAAVADLRGDQELPLYCVRFRPLDTPDPRDELAASADLTQAELASLTTRLARMDKTSKRGPWTMQVLQEIARRPAVSSAIIAPDLSWDRPDFKLHVRRLKALGLTISLDVGYRISPRGQAYLSSVSGAP